MLQCCIFINFIYYRFSIGIRTSKPGVSNSNIGLSLTTYFREDFIVRNSFIDEQWGDEETTLNLIENSLHNPIVPGEFFIVCFYMTENKFYISINNRKFCTYNYRLPLEKLKTIEVNGHIQTIKQVDHRTIFPSPWPPIHSSDFGKAFSNDIPILFTPGHVIVLKARCYDNEKGIIIFKFLDYDTKREEFHMSCRFENKIIVRNAMKKDFSFGVEEKDGRFPFVHDQEFKIAFGFTELEFLVAIDGSKFTSFKYRTNNALNTTVGLKITCLSGLKIHVTSLDHVLMGNSECKGFENYSRPDAEIL